MSLLHVSKLLRWQFEAPRRYLSRIFYNEMIGFRDSDMELGEERVPLHEQEFIDRTLEILRARHKRDYPAGVRPMPRDFHGKAHGCVAARFEIDNDLPAEARYGVFKRPEKQYLAVVRFSNASRDLGSDRLPNQHGMAIKLILDDGGHQDFLLSDFPVNFIQDAEQSYYFYRAEAANRPLSYFLRNPSKFAITLLGSSFQPPVDVFDITYFSQTPYRLGPSRACKYMAVPIPEVTTPPGPAPPPGPIGSSPNFLSERMASRFRAATPERPIRFGFYVQPQRHPLRQPIEDACFEWDREEAPPIKVGTITLDPVEAIPFTSPEAKWHAELLSFNPDHCLPEHKPIGGLNRVRRAVYKEFAAMRFAANGVEERRGEDALPPGYRRPTSSSSSSPTTSSPTTSSPTTSSPTTRPNED